MQTIMNQVVGGSRGLSYCFFCSIRAEKWEKDADWMTKDEARYKKIGRSQEPFALPGRCRAAAGMHEGPGHVWLTAS